MTIRKSTPFLSTFQSLHELLNIKGLLPYELNLKYKDERSLLVPSFSNQYQLLTHDLFQKFCLSRFYFPSFDENN